MKNLSSLIVMLTTLLSTKAFSYATFNPELQKKAETEIIQKLANEKLPSTCKIKPQISVDWSTYDTKKMYDKEPSSWGAAQAGEKVVEALASLCSENAKVLGTTSKLKKIEIKFGGTSGKSKINFKDGKLELEAVYEPLADGRAEYPKVTLDWAQGAVSALFNK